MNYIEKLKELRDKATTGPWFNEVENQIWGADDNVVVANTQYITDLQLVINMRNSLDLWLELAEEAERVAETIKFIRNSSNKMFSDMVGGFFVLGEDKSLERALKALRGEDE